MDGLISSIDTLIGEQRSGIPLSGLLLIDHRAGRTDFFPRAEVYGGTASARG